MNYGFWNDSHEQNIINLTRHSRISSGKADPKGIAILLSFQNVVVLSKYLIDNKYH